jgi:hypothetical protein
MKTRHIFIIFCITALVQLFSCVQSKEQQLEEHKLSENILSETCEPSLVFFITDIIQNENNDYIDEKTDTSNVNILKSALIRAASDEYLGYIDLVTSNDTVNMLFYDSNLVVYDAVFMRDFANCKWLLKRVFQPKTFKSHFFSSLYEINETIYFKHKCKSEKLIISVCDEEGCSSNIGGSGPDSIPMNFGMIICNSINQIGSDSDTIFVSGIGTGIGAFYRYSKGCLVEHFDASN